MPVNVSRVPRDPAPIYFRFKKRKRKPKDTCATRLSSLIAESLYALRTISRSGTLSIDCARGSRGKDSGGIERFGVKVNDQSGESEKV